MHAIKYDQWCEFYDPEGIEDKVLYEVIDFCDKDILEIGCGTGRLSFKILSEVRSLVGIDIEPEAISICNNKKKNSIHQDKALFYLRNANNLDFKDSSFDYVIFSWSIYLIEQKRALLEKTSRILKDGGSVIILQPIGGDFEESLHLFYKNSNIDQFNAHNEEAISELSKIFCNYKEYKIESNFVFPDIEKTIDMMEFFIQDEDKRSLSMKETGYLKENLQKFVAESGCVVMSDIVNVIISVKNCN